MVAKLFTKPFGVAGDKTPIPNGTQVDGTVSYETGFGADYERQLGVDPAAKNIDRQSFNELMFDATTSLQEMQAGEGVSVFSAALAAARPGAGYAKGAVIPRSDSNGYWISTAAANADNPEVTAGKWVPVDVQGSFTQALTNVNVTLSLLNAGFPQLIFTGTLAGNVNVIVPAWVYEYRIVNQCTGSFTVTIKTAAGVGVVVANDTTVKVMATSTGVGFSESSLQQQQKGLQRYTTSGSFIVPAGVTQIWVSGCAGGGGGGGSGSNTLANIAAAGGGGGGAGQSTLRQPFTVVPGAVISITIGAGGTQGMGGTVGANNAGTGGNGGNTVVGALVTLTGGSGGVGGFGSAAPAGIAGGFGGAGFPAGSDAGDGGVGSSNGWSGTSGAGGSGPFGGGGGTRRSAQAVASVGIAGSGFGSGGGGGGAPYNTTAASTAGAVGGVGAPGYVEVEW